MEWLGLVLFALALGIGVAIAAEGWLTSLPLGLVPVLLAGGLALCVLYLTSDGENWMAWASAGLALAGAAVVTLGAETLMSDAPRVRSAGQQAEEVAAGLAGLEIPLLITLTIVMIVAAVGVTTVG